MHVADSSHPLKSGMFASDTGLAAIAHIIEARLYHFQRDANTRMHIPRFFDSGASIW